MEEERKCLECGKPVFGRVDKKFCSDGCRNIYNNKTKGTTTNYIRNVNNILSKNRRILLELNPEGKTTKHREQLLKKGFDFEYCTRTITTRDGKVYRFCYEQGYLQLDNDFVLLVQRED